jgi:hypothetical protein
MKLKDMIKLISCELMMDKHLERAGSDEAADEFATV